MSKRFPVVFALMALVVTLGGCCHACKQTRPAACCPPPGVAAVGGPIPNTAGFPPAGSIPAGYKP